MIDITDFIRQSEEYAEKAGISLSRLGKLVANDGKFFSRIHNSGRLDVGKLNHVLEYYKTVPPGGHRKQKRGRKAKSKGTSTCHNSRATTSP